MCGRYTTTNHAQQTMADRFGPFDLRSVPLETIGRANVCPTEPVLAVVGAAGGAPGAREARALRWGLAPSWATLRGMKPLINARDDKLRSSGAWKKLAADGSHRCLVIADGWIEWQKPEDKKAPRQPFWHRLPGGEPFAFAGLWTVAQPKDGTEPVASCTIVTTSSNREAAILHDRMPAVLAGPEAEEAWLSPDVDLDGALELVHPLPDATLEVLPVSCRLNAAGVEGLDLLQPDAPAPAAATSSTPAAGDDDGQLALI